MVGSDLKPKPKPSLELKPTRRACARAYTQTGHTNRTSLKGTCTWRPFMEKDDEWTTIDDPPPGSCISVAVRANASVYMHLQPRDER